MNIRSMQKIQKAKNFAKNLHKNQTRMSGEPVYDHLLAVCNRLKDTGVQDENILIAALLHQALYLSEDLQKDIQTEFGKEVSQLVRNYYDLSSSKLAHEGTQGINEKYIIQTYLNMAKDLRVLLIRLADKAENIKTAFALPKKHQKYIAERALYVYAPISRLLGLQDYTRDLENGAFKILSPKQYYLIEKVVEEKTPEIERFFSENIPAVRDLLREQGINAEISYRIKHIYGIHKKAIQLSKKGERIEKNFAGLYDIAAMRVIVASVENCYRAEALLCDLWNSIPERRDDYIKVPKPSGYRSIHNIHIVDQGLKIESQIRTKQMHEHNEYGPASHFFYKVGKNLADNLEKNPDWLKELASWNEEQKSLDKEAGLNQFKDNVYAFTPEGDIVELPEGSTPIDFAYALHSDIGDKCVSAIVNENIEKLDYKIKDGDQIEIRTLSTRKLPSKDWLDFVKTARAKHHIKKAYRMD